MDPKSTAVFEVEFRDVCGEPELAKEVAEPELLDAVTVIQYVLPPVNPESWQDRSDEVVLQVVTRLVSDEFEYALAV